MAILANGPEGYGAYWVQSQLDNFVAQWGENAARQKLDNAMAQYAAQKLSSTAAKKKPSRIRELNCKPGTLCSVKTA